MAYIGNAPAEAYTNTVKDTFSGNGSTVAFTLSLPSTTNNVRVVVENVIQDPTVAYSVSGTTLTFTSAPPSGTNNIYAVHLGPAVQTVQPPTELSGNFTLTGDLTQTGDYDLTGAATVSGGNANNNNDANTIVATGTNHVRLKVHTPTTGGFRASLVLSSDEAVTATGNEVTISTTGSDEMQFATAGTERMRIDASGNVLIGGTTVATSAGGLNVEVSSSGNSVSPLTLQNQSTGNGSGVYLAFRGQRNTGAQADYTYIQSVADDTTAGNGSIRFHTNNSGTISERARIDASGNLLVGTTTAFGTAGTTIASPDSSGFWSATTSAGGINHLRFYNPNGVVGGISTNGVTTSYTTSSDYRLKENVVPLAGAADRLMQIPVCRFNFTADPDRTVDGFLAHEVQAFVPECVTGEKDAVETVEVTDEDGNVTTETRPVYQGIDQSKLVPLLTAALQEALQKIEALEARIVSLEGGAA